MSTDAGSPPSRGPARARRYGVAALVLVALPVRAMTVLGMAAPRVIWSGRYTFVAGNGDAVSSTTSERTINRSRTLAIRLGFAAVTFVLCIGVAEVALRYLAPVADPFGTEKTRKPMNQYIRSEFPRNYQIRTQTEDGLPGVTGWHVFTTNNMGFRGDHLQQPKPAEEFRIFMVGGSTTECLYLDDSESIDRIVQDELSAQNRPHMRVKVYNAGKSGDALDDHISMIVHRIVHLQPDLVVVFPGVNDLTRSIYGSDPLHFPRGSITTLDFPELLKLAATEFQLPRRSYYLYTRLAPRPPTRILEEITRRSNYRERVELRRSAPVSDAKPRVDLDSYKANLRTIVGVARGHGWSLLLLTQQSTWNSGDPRIKDWQWVLHRNGVTYREDLMHDALEALNDVMRQVAAASHVPIYDLARVIPKSADFFYDDVHFNVRGAREAGAAVASFMIAKGLIEWSRP